ncbi:RNA-protein complex protein Nop10 [Candidatus Woesearchaeota archaeon]|nr:RNA-protein complex protein Nop10 [Candidatus Woesearchaeota archaeon]
MRRILKCTACGSYTLAEACKCGAKAVSPAPAKWNPADPYGKYRRHAKHESRQEAGLI